MPALSNGALTMDDTRMRRRFTVDSLAATRQQLLTEQNVFRALTLIVFCLVVFSLLLYCDFLPFGTDNNETFSSLLHAKSMYLHGIGSAYGLTSETTSPNPEAVPFIYTHQGNFPRFYALLLYLLGARSAEAQILLTTLTIGTTSILFAHFYMERRVNALFAFIFCSVLITDYIMSLQWLVNTWRVWHFFFFFSTLLLADVFAESGKSCFLLFINFACLFYFELIFATFVAIFFALYLAFLLRRQPRRLVLGWAVSGLGSAFAITLLCLQVILYLGWQGFLSDLSYTFLSRSFSPSASPADLAAFKERVIGFMREHKVVFWDNFASRLELRRPGEMLRLFYRFSLTTQTPMLVILSLLLTLSAWLHGGASALRVARAPMLPSDVIAWMRSKARPDHAAALLVPAFVLFGVVVTVSGTSYGITDPHLSVIAGSSIHFISASLVIASATVLFLSVYQHLGTAKVPAACLLVIVAFAGALQSYEVGLAALAMLSAITSAASALWVISSRCGLTNARVVLATAFLIAFAAFAHYHAWLYQPIHYDIAPNHFEPLWSEFVARLGGHTFWRIVIVATAFVSTLIILGVIDDAESPGSVASLVRIVPYWLIGMVAYVIVFVIAAGYVYTAYQVHNAPFAIYLSSVAGAGAVYVLCVLAREHLSAQLIGAYRTIASGRTMLAVARAILVCAVLVVIVGTWLTVQATYLRRIPPARVASMFHALDKIAGASTVVSTYATPVAIRTGQWSYFDPTFFHEGEQLAHGYRVSPQDFRYLWFSDWESNPAYRTPEYFVCWLHLNFFDVVSPTKRWTCGNNVGVGAIRQGRSVFDHKEVFRDEKYDLWSIVKLDWDRDYPPYLRPLDESDTVRATLVPREDGIGFAVEIDPRQQEGHPVKGVYYSLYVDTGDNPTCAVSSRRLIKFADSATELLLPKDFKGCVQIGVAPFTETKTGSEYHSGILMIGLDPTRSLDPGSWEE
jgi:hypothetical protein